MIALPTLAAFALVVFGMALTPGPNMAYLVSRSISQGHPAGLISLTGTAVGFMIYLALAAFGLTVILMAVPFAYDALRFGGAAYLLWLAWNAVRPGGASPFQVSALPVSSPRRLFAMGLMTNLLNPKIALLYLSLLPQFVDPERGHVVAQSFILGGVQIIISLAVNATMIFAAGSIAKFLAERPFWARLQRWIMGGMLGGLAVRMAVEARK
jgi:threonine/homoserine/homoserine lactone efflux protein